MIGPELAAALAPFAMWGGIIVGTVGLIALVRYWVRRGARREAQAEERLEALGKMAKEHQDASEDYRHTVARRLARWRRKRLQHK